jgi:hypothetical protein
MARAKNGLEFDSYDSFEIVRIAQDEEIRALREDHVDEVGTRSFAAAHPEFHQCDENAAAMGARLAEYGDGERLPCTMRNLELVYRELLTEGKLKTAPPEPAKADAGNPSITLTVTDALLEYQKPSDEAAALAKVADDPNLSDHARKARDRRLALLAGQQRRELAPQNLYR